MKGYSGHKKKMLQEERREEKQQRQKREEYWFLEDGLNLLDKPLSQAADEEY